MGGGEGKTPEVAVVLFEFAFTFPSVKTEAYIDDIFLFVAQKFVTLIFVAISFADCKFYLPCQFSDVNIFRQIFIFLWNEKENTLYHSFSARNFFANLKLWLYLIDISTRSQFYVAFETFLADFLSCAWLGQKFKRFFLSQLFISLLCYYSFYTIGLYWNSHQFRNKQKSIHLKWQCPGIPTTLHSWQQKSCWAWAKQDVAIFNSQSN